MSLKAKLEALIYAAEEPITPDQMAALLKEDLVALKAGQPEATPAPAASAGVTSGNAADPAAKRAQQKSERAELRALLKPFLEELVAEYARDDHGIEVRQVAGGYRMSTKPEHHDVVRAFSKSLKPPVRLSLQALETLAVIAYKQPVTVPEISDIRGVDASAVIGTLLERKLVTTAGRKAVVGRPMLYKTSKDFLLRFGLKDLSELPSLEEFEKLAAGELQEELAASGDSAVADATGVPDHGGAGQLSDDQAGIADNVTEPAVSSDPRHNQADEQAADQIASESRGG
ncbi:MAG TPA: SMC-Scp complex subunit ScpB [Candidatus Angelobacter sp.]|nr:SMC-Scp complex subunit ScpB [Candidatus Angelobacter sp.]